MEASASASKPVWQWKVGEKVWLRLPMGMGLGVTIFYLIVGVMAGSEALSDLFAHDGLYWGWDAAGLTGGGLQVVLCISSLWALRIQKKRDRALKCS